MQSGDVTARDRTVLSSLAGQVDMALCSITGMAARVISDLIGAGKGLSNTAGMVDGFVGDWTGSGPDSGQMVLKQRTFLLMLPTRVLKFLPEL